MPGDYLPKHGGSALPSRAPPEAVTALELRAVEGESSLGGSGPYGQADHSHTLDLSDSSHCSWKGLELLQFVARPDAPFHALVRTDLELVLLRFEVDL